MWETGRVDDRRFLRPCIAVDFDGCLTMEDVWPEIGEPRAALIEAVRDAQGAGCAVVLWTCRNGEALARAVEWLMARGLIPDAINDNLRERAERFGGDTRKVAADLLLDDRAPLWSEDAAIAAVEELARRARGGAVGNCEL